MKYNEIESLTKELKYAKAEAARFKEEHQGACHLVAQMHAAAVGEVTGPNRGVIEDVEDLRLRAEKAERELADRKALDGSNDSFVSSSKRVRQRDYDALMREREQVGNALGERTQERDEARAALKSEDLRLSRDQWKQEWELSERNRMDREAEIVKLKAKLAEA